MASNSFFAGIKYALSGFGMIFRPKLRRFVMIPTLINITIFSIALWFGYQWLDSLINSWLPTWLEWLRYVIWPILAFLAMVVIFSTFTIVANLIGSPFNSLLAEAAETRLAGQTLMDNPNVNNLAKDSLLSIQSEISKLIFFGIRAIPLFIMLFIPGINLIASLLWFLFGAWMMVHQYMDYPMDNNGYKFAQQRPMLRKKPLLAIGFGTTIMLMTMIPILNFIAMPVAVCGATIMWHEQFRENRSDNTINNR